MTNSITLNESLEATQSPVASVPNESFYLERFKNAVNTTWIRNGRVVDTDFHCEIYKGFAIVIWEQQRQLLNNQTKSSFSNYIWEVGGLFDKLANLSWIAQGCVSTGYNARTLEQAIKKSKKKIDLLAVLYREKQELQALSHTYGRRITHDEDSLYNARIGDVVALRAFGRSRLGKVVALTGNRFVVGYMTPSNPNDVHYKTVTLEHLFPKEKTN